jgi:hypothetical protein
MVLVRVLALAAGASALAARNVKVDGQRFVVAATGEEIVLSGPNVVVKGPPWLPSVALRGELLELLGRRVEARARLHVAGEEQRARELLVRHFWGVIRAVVEAPRHRWCIPIVEAR